MNGIILPPVNWEALNAEELSSKIQHFCEMCEGKGHPALLHRGPTFRPDESTPYVNNACGIIRWALRMCGQGAENLTRFESRPAEEIVADREAYFWEMYRHYHRFQLQLVDASSISHLDILNDANTLKRFALAYEVCDRIWQLQKNVYDLYRMMLNRSDFVVPECVMQSQVHKSLLCRHKCADEPDEKRSDVVEVFYHLLDCAARNRYRKYGDVVYEEKIVEYCGYYYGSRAWEPANFGSTRPDGQGSTISAFVTRFCRKETHGEMWSKLINMRGDGRKKIEDMLMNQEDTEFPFLRPCRHIFSFKNGIYNSMGENGGVFYSYAAASDHLLPDTVAAKYFDIVVDHEWIEKASRGRWWDIPTPLFQSILDYQNWGVHIRNRGGNASAAVDAESRGDVAMAEVVRICETMDSRLQTICYHLERCCESDVSLYLKEFKESAESLAKSAQLLLERTMAQDAEAPSSSEQQPDNRRPSAGTAFPVEAQRWVYIFLGRLLHELGTYDSWQIIPFFKGRGGTGKSTVAHIAKNFFSAGDVGVMSNNMEKKFGLQGLVGKLIFLCFELKKNVSLDQAEFQSMVSGEEVAVAIKNHAAKTMQWKIPGLLCGNESPGWVDAQGSIARRLAIFSFNYTINEKDSDPDLLQRILKEELAMIIIKCNTAYRDMADRHRGEDIWHLLPDYFRKERLALQRDTDPLYCAILDENTFELARRDKIPLAECYMPFDDFEAEYKRRHRDIRGNNFPDALNQDKYGQAFWEHALEVVTDTRMYADQERQQKWIIGIRPRRSSFVSPL